MMNVVIPRRHDQPLQPIGSPRHVDMHPVVLQGIEHADHQSHPPRSPPKERPGENIRKIHQNLLRHGGTRSREPIHIGWGMMPFMNPPDMRRMHEAMNPIMAEVGDHEIAQYADWERHGQDRVRQLGADGDIPVDVSRRRKDDKLKHDEDRQIVQNHLPIGHLSSRPQQLNRCNPDQSSEKQQREKQIVIE